MKKKAMFTAAVLAAFALGIWMCVGDVLHHGYYSDRPENAASAMETDALYFKDGVLECQVTAQQVYWEAIECFFSNPIPHTELKVEVLDAAGRVLKTGTVSTADSWKQGIWNKFDIELNAQRGGSYLVRITSGEKITQPILLFCAYGRDSLTAGMRIWGIAFSFLSASALMVLIWCEGYRREKALLYGVIPAAMVFLLTWTYYANPFDRNNTEFKDFQYDSDALVYSRVAAMLDGSATSDYGLGMYSTIAGERAAQFSPRYQDIVDMQDDSVQRGYSTVFPGIVVCNNNFTRNYLVKENFIMAENGDRYRIKEVWVEHDNLCVEIDSEEMLTQDKFGKIEDVQILSSNGEILPRGQYNSYGSSVGLQGWVLGKIGALVGHHCTLILPLLCAAASAVMVVAMVYLLKYKYNSLLAGVFYAVFWLSPWITNFAKSIYWVEFTWVLPSIVGIIISIKNECRGWRMIGYLCMTCAILVKCLCGYEYISFIMVCAVLPLCMDLYDCILMRDRMRKLRLFRVLLLTGLAALIGFAVAVLIHSNIRGNGNILQGVKEIYQQDVLRRTLGGDVDKFDPVYHNSINASVFEVLRTYIQLPTEILLGSGKNGVALIAILPGILFIICKVRGLYLSSQNMVLYAISFLGSLSWFVLAKQHSFIHVFVNYVAWYYPFVPICIYLIIKQALDILTDYFQKKAVKL